MDFINILVLVSAVVVLVSLWIIVAVRNLRALRVAVETAWESVDNDLRKRVDLIPNLVETMMKYNPSFIADELISARMKAVSVHNPSGEKVEYEHDISRLIDGIFAYGQENREFGSDVNLLELKTQIFELNDTIDANSLKYNDVVRIYNAGRNAFFLKPVAIVFGFPLRQIFEYEK